MTIKHTYIKSLKNKIVKDYQIVFQQEHPPISNSINYNDIIN